MTNHLPARPAPSARRSRSWLPGLLVCAGLAACGPDTTREQQVRTVIATAQAAASEHDLSGLMALVSPRYADEGGGSAVELSRRLRGYFVVYPSVHVITRIDRVEFPYQDLARVQLTVGTLGRKALPQDALDVAANLHDVRLELRLERGEWKVTRAAWAPVVGS